MASKPVVMVIGASGNIGIATLNALASSHGSTLDIRAGVRDPTKDEKFKELKDSITLVQATMGDESLQQSLRGVDRLFIVTPGAENRAELAIKTAKYAQEAGVKRILVVSVSVACSTSTVFGKQFNEIESSIKKLSVPWTFLRLPLFIENYFLHQNSIVNESKIRMPVGPHKPYTPVLTSDAGKAAAVILADPAKHAGKTYRVVSNRHTFGEACREFSKQLGKDIQYEQIPFADLKKVLIQVGLADWQATGVVELYQLIDKRSHVTNEADLNDFRKITGNEPTSLHEWVSSVKSAFQ